MIRAVLFDIDDTLVDTRGAFRHALGTVAAEYLQRVPSADELANVWRTDAGGYYRAHTRGEISYREQRMLRANALHVMYGGPELDDEAYDAWNEDFERAFQEGWRAHEDAAASLDVLDAEGIPYGALSNAAVAYQELKLAKCGLERVPMLVGVDTLGFGKPDPVSSRSLASASASPQARSPTLATNWTSTLKPPWPSGSQESGLTATPAPTNRRPASCAFRTSARLPSLQPFDEIMRRTL
ncbi:MAG: HAD family hydrolase [Demequina sp.]|nr:HAD family hydrolase [Demequina sp.]